MDIATNLNRLMNQAGMTQAELARATKMSTAQIAYLCSGKTKDPKLSTMAKISFVLRCTLDDLAGSTDSTAPLDQTVVRTLVEEEKDPKRSARSYSDDPPSPTEQALAESMRTLLREKRFEGITITEICKRAGVSRRTFYRHFIDKYDLLTWSFYHNVSQKIKHHDDWVSWDYVPVMCRLFSEDRDYYRNAYLVVGRNSFREYATRRMYPLVAHDFVDCDAYSELKERLIIHSIAFVYDAIMLWLDYAPDVTPERFSRSLRRDFGAFARVLCESAERAPRSDEASPSSNS